MEIEKNTKTYIQNGDYCILKRGDQMSIFEVRDGMTKRFAKKEVQIGSLIGKKYGQWIELKENVFVDSKSPEELIASFVDRDQQLTKDNRNLIDNNTNQQLTHESISKMKEEGKGGQEIIQELLSHSDSYDGKTMYSQEKYVKKKIDKHVLLYQVLEVTPITLCDYQNSKGQFKAGRLREDMLSYILFHSDLRGRIGVMENCNGLILGSVLRAVSDTTEVFSVTRGGEHMNLVSMLARKRIIEEKEGESKKERMERELGYTSIKFETQELPKVNSLIIVSDMNPFDSLKVLYPSLQLSGTIVIYCQYLDKLAKAFDFMCKSGAVVYCDVFEPFTRTIQVLPNRTHPLVQFDANAGYVLFGMKTGELKWGDEITEDIQMVEKKDDQMIAQMEEDDVCEMKEIKQTKDDDN